MAKIKKNIKIYLWLTMLAFLVYSIVSIVSPEHAEQVARGFALLIGVM